MKKLFLGALILTTLAISGCKSEKEKQIEKQKAEQQKIDKLFEIDESLSGEGKSADVMRGFKGGKESNYN